MKLAIGSDMACNLSQVVCDHIRQQGHEIMLFGALSGATADYVDAARGVAEAVADGRCQQGLIFCFTGTGVTIIANKVRGVRAALCVDSFAAQIARLANNANVLVLSIRLTGEPLAKEIVDTWLKTEPSTEPRRVNFHRKTDELEAISFDGGCGAEMTKR
jgi:ribose 5-phosphate isomerase B